MEEAESAAGKQYEVEKEGDGALRGTRSSLRGRVWRRLQNGLFRRQAGVKSPGPRGGAFMRRIARLSHVQIRK